MTKYTNQQLTSAEVIAELIEMAKEIAAERDRGKAFAPPLNEDELAFYDAVVAEASRRSRCRATSVLAEIARDLVEVMRRDVKTDWTVRDDVRAKLRSPGQAAAREAPLPAGQAARGDHPRHRADGGPRAAHGGLTASMWPLVPCAKKICETAVMDPGVRRPTCDHAASCGGRAAWGSGSPGSRQVGSRVCPCNGGNTPERRAQLSARGGPEGDPVRPSACPAPSVGSNVRNSAPFAPRTSVAGLGPAGANGLRASTRPVCATMVAAKRGGIRSSARIAPGARTARWPIGQGRFGCLGRDTGWRPALRCGLAPETLPWRGLRVDLGALSFSPRR